MPRFHSYCLPFQSEGNYALICQHSWFNGMPSDEKIPAASSLLAGGKVAHFENESKTPLSILDELGVKLLGKEYSIQDSKYQWYSIKNVFEINESKSLHSFWTTPYINSLTLKCHTQKCIPCPRKYWYHIVLIFWKLLLWPDRNDGNFNVEACSCDVAYH